MRELLEMCDCTEGPGYDCEYVRARNRLIPQAVEIANAKATCQSAAKWTKVFADAMDELAKPLLSGNAPSL